MFVLKSTLSNINIATPALFWWSFAWYVFVYSLTFNMFVSLKLKWSLVDSVAFGHFFYLFFIHSANLCLSVGGITGMDTDSL